MTQTIQAKVIDLRHLIDTFSIELVLDGSFFGEWQQDLPEINDLDKKLLDKVKTGYLNILNYPTLLEDVVRMAVVDPLLFIGDFYLAPFYIKSEESIEIAVPDEDVIIKGRIDTLVLKEQFWVMIIESKRASFSVEQGLAQIISYLLGSPHNDRPSFGMIATGSEFIFVKLVKGNRPRYALSKGFLMRNPGNELYDVLRILKRLTQLVSA
ncbi:type I site-specific deoxyribonuclease [Nostoc sp. DSM 114161]|jgi:hypothetical protein|uniref:restriction endonuclease subunit R n=1 Tax=Nostoc sp. DSM 114161 TaxID=3440143 RepID=UPI0040466F6C